MRGVDDIIDPDVWIQTQEFLNELQTTEYVRNSGIDYNIIQKISDLLEEIRKKAFDLDDPEYFEDYEESQALEKVLSSSANRY